MSDTERYYSWDIITYLSEEQFLPILQEHFNSWAYIYHDKDTKEDGKEKEPHWHIVGSKRNKSSFQSMVSLFDVGTQNTRFIGIKGQEAIKERYIYLDHRNEPTKYRYNSSDIREHDSYYWIKVTKDIAVTRSSNDEFMDDLMDEDVSIEEMGRKYGRDFMRYARSYIDFKCMVINEREKKLANDVPKIKPKPKKLYLCESCNKAILEEYMAEIHMSTGMGICNCCMSQKGRRILHHDSQLDKAK